VIAGTQPRPGGKVPRGGELRHVDARFGEDRFARRAWRHRASSG
jgi:hypothetical protein